MRQYISIWIAVVVLAVLAEWLIPGGKQGKMTGHIRFLIGLCLIVSFLPAAKAGMEFLIDLGDESFPAVSDKTDAVYQDAFSEQISHVTQEAVENWVYEMLEQRYAVPRDHCAVVAHMVTIENLPQIQKISIVLKRTAILQNPHVIEKYVTDMLSVPCSVSVDLPISLSESA